MYFIMTFSPSISGGNSVIQRNIYARSAASTGYKPETYVLKVDPSHTGIIKRGTLLGAYASGMGTDATYDNKLYLYDDAESDGRETAVGVLDNVDIPESSLFTVDNMGNKIPADIAVSVLIPSGGEAELRASLLTGLDNNAVIDLNGTIDPSRDIFTF